MSLAELAVKRENFDAAENLQSEARTIPHKSGIDEYMEKVQSALRDATTSQ